MSQMRHGTGSTESLFRSQYVITQQLCTCRLLYLFGTSSGISIKSGTVGDKKRVLEKSSSLSLCLQMANTPYAYITCCPFLGQQLVRLTSLVFKAFSLASIFQSRVVPWQFCKLTWFCRETLTGLHPHMIVSVTVYPRVICSGSCLDHIVLICHDIVFEIRKDVQNLFWEPWDHT